MVPAEPQGAAEITELEEPIVQSSPITSSDRNMRSGMAEFEVCWTVLFLPRLFLALFLAGRAKAPQFITVASSIL